MNNQASITALMSSFGRAFHAENEEHPVFTDHLAKKLMTEEEYAAVQGYILDGAQFFEPEIDPAKQKPKELLRRLVNVHIAPSPLCRGNEAATIPTPARAIRLWREEGRLREEFPPEITPEEPRSTGHPVRRDG